MLLNNGGNHSHGASLLPAAREAKAERFTPQFL